MDFETILSQLIENPDAAAFIIKPLVEKYMPFINVGAEVLYKAGIELQEQYVSSGYAVASAKARKAKFDAYVEAGFTEDQAMSLLLTDVRQVATLAKGDLSKAADAVSGAVKNA